MATYCSSVVDAVITSSGETLSIELVSDEKKQRQGFAAQFAFIAGAGRTDSGTADDRPSPLLPPSSGLMVDVTETTHQLQTVLQQLGGRLPTPLSVNYSVNATLYINDFWHCLIFQTIVFEKHSYDLISQQVPK